MKFWSATAFMESRELVQVSRLLDEYGDHGWMVSGVTRCLFAWHFAVKLAFRLIAYALAPSAQKNDRYALVLRAWYQVRYSLFPDVVN